MSHAPVSSLDTLFDSIQVQAEIDQPKDEVSLETHFRLLDGPISKKFLRESPIHILSTGLQRGVPDKTLVTGKQLVYLFNSLSGANLFIALPRAFKLLKSITFIPEETDR